LTKIGAAILRNTRRVQIMLASHHPMRELFALVATRLSALSADKHVGKGVLRPKLVQTLSSSCHPAHQPPTSHSTGHSTRTSKF
jgi:hypothetical protein